MTAEAVAASDSPPAPQTGGAIRVPVSFGADDPRAYDIVIAAGALDRIGAEMRRLTGSQRTAVVADETVAGLYGGPVSASLAEAGFNSQTIAVPPGEASKSFRRLEGLVEALLKARIERGDLIVALGGGVVGDLAGFAAAILRRGIGFVQVPTTLLAQVDSSVGGKTGINLRQGKNLAGAFHQPRLVLADLAALDTLPERQMRAGYAEVVKYGLIGDAAFFAWLEADGARVLAGDRAAQAHAVETSCRAKAAIVAEDEREVGKRALLNLGHTFGHAMEAAMGYDGRLLHGEAVAAGMALAFDLSVRLGLCPAADAARVRTHLGRAGLPTSLQEAQISEPAETLIELMGQDKKVRGGRLTFVLARGIGQAFLSRDVARSDLLDLLTQPPV